MIVVDCSRIVDDICRERAERLARRLREIGVEATVHGSSVTIPPAGTLREYGAIDSPPDPFIFQAIADSVGGVPR